MKTIPIAGPIASAVDTGVQSSSAKAARERAIAKLTESGPQGQNQNQMSPEEFTRLQANQRAQETVNQGQASNQEAATASSQTETQAPVEDPKVPSVKEEPAISSQYAVLARKEKQFRQKVAEQQAQLQAERQALEAEKAKIAAKDAEYNSNYIPKNRLTEDTINVLLENGLSYDQITQMVLQQGTIQQDPVLKAQLAEIKAQIKAQQDLIEESKNAAQQAQQQQYNEAITQITHETEMLVKSDPSFEAIRETNSVKDVVELIEKTYKEDGVLLTVEEAAKEVEDHLIEQLSNYSQKIKKLQQKFQPNTQAPQSSANQAKPQQTQQATQVKTLTNSMATGKPLTARERAVLAFEGKLNK